MEPEANRLLTVEEAAEKLNTGVRFVRRLIAERRIWYTTSAGTSASPNQRSAS